ncbi:MAG TPA: hypothetical protein VJH03_07080 [Blastocatellia bacterium]|nr:hypothetical protein [Blastocatellia bacterium]
MSITPNESREIGDLCREELDDAARRITERLTDFECRTVRRDGDRFEDVRRFYEDLADKTWTESDETALATLDDLGATEIKRMMREAFRRSRLFPAPGFAYLISLIRKGEGAPVERGSPLANPDAIPAAERERIASILQKELGEAAREIADRLTLDKPNADVVRFELERVAAQIVSELTPLG